MNSQLIKYTLNSKPMLKSISNQAKRLYSMLLKMNVQMGQYLCMDKQLQEKRIQCLEINNS